jgi:hypothetical protein
MSGVQAMAVSPDSKNLFIGKPDGLAHYDLTKEPYKIVRKFSAKNDPI